MTDFIDFHSEPGTIEKDVSLCHVHKKHQKTPKNTNVGILLIQGQKLLRNFGSPDMFHRSHHRPMRLNARSP